MLLWGVVAVKCQHGGDLVVLCSGVVMCDVVVWCMAVCGMVCGGFMW